MTQIRILDPVEHRSDPPVTATGKASSTGLRGATVAFAYLEDWRNFESFLDRVEERLKDEFGIAGVRRISSSLRRGPLTRDDLESIRGSTAAIVGLGA
jgi:hypothetical protein